MRTTLPPPSQRRRLRTISQPHRPVITLDGREVIDFCSNDTLGLSQHPALIEAARQAVETYGVGTGGARLIGGTLDLHTRLEALLAEWKGTEAALVFNSGYQANVGVLSALVDRHDVIFADRLNHASLVDGAILSRARLVRYPHLDLSALETHLKATPAAKRKWIVTDTVFSMEGDLAPLADLFVLAQQYDAWLILDEAHATGVFGDKYRSGLWETTGLGAPDRVIQVGTFSKALGSFGAYVAASQTVIDTLIQNSRSFIYSTSLPPAVIAANIAAIELVQTDASLTQDLWDNVRCFQSKAKQLGMALSVSSPIVPIILGSSEMALETAQHLLEAGYYVQAIRPPTVPQGSARLRVTLSARHTPEQIRGFVKGLRSG